MRTTSIKCTTLIVALTSSTLVFAVPAPKYLEINNVQQCLSEMTKGSATFVCVPQRKPAACQSSSWKKLKSLKGGQKVPACISEK